jgi:hypothetical protein
MSTVDHTVNRTDIPSTADARTGTGTKIGTEVFGVRVVSGAVHPDEPGSIVLRQLYPGQSADIGVIDSIENGTGQTTIYPGHRREWTDRDRLRLAEFFAARYTERFPDPPRRRRRYPRCRADRSIRAALRTDLDAARTGARR